MSKCWAGFLVGSTWDGVSNIWLPIQLMSDSLIIMGFWGSRYDKGAAYRVALHSVESNNFLGVSIRVSLYQNSS